MKKEIFHFGDRLMAKISEMGTPICVGLDTKFDRVPEFLRKKYLEMYPDKLEAAVNAILEFEKGIIDAVYNLVPAVKPQSACYELYGYHGMKVFGEICSYAKSKGLIVIGDVKRGDIGVTAESYSDAYLGNTKIGDEEVKLYDLDAVTLSPYLGHDSIKPFVENGKKYGKGSFVLVKTSNKSSSDLQDVNFLHNGVETYLHEIVGQYVDSWGADEIGESGFSSVGAVVGATFPEQAKRLRELMPNTIFLVPGYGAQGGSAKDVKNCFNENGEGALINSSRGICMAYVDSRFDEKEFGEAAREAVLLMYEDLK